MLLSFRNNFGDFHRRSGIGRPAAADYLLLPHASRPSVFFLLANTHTEIQKEELLLLLCVCVLFSRSWLLARAAASIEWKKKGGEKSSNSVERIDQSEEEEEEEVFLGGVHLVHLLVGLRFDNYVARLAIGSSSQKKGGSCVCVCLVCCKNFGAAKESAHPFPSRAHSCRLPSSHIGQGQIVWSSSSRFFVGSKARKEIKANPVRGQAASASAQSVLLHLPGTTKKLAAAKAECTNQTKMDTLVEDTLSNNNNKTWRRE